MQHNWTSSRKPGSPRFIGTIALILLVAAVLRLGGLPDILPGPHYDEAANGILAAEIADGVKTPVFIPSYTGKEVMFFYGAAMLMRLLGIGLLALRLAAALSGLLTVIATVWLIYELFADEDPVAAAWLSAMTAALLATSFWHVLLSRIGFRAITQPLLQALTLAALWRGLRQSKRRDSANSSRAWILLSGLLCGFTGYTYLAARAFPVPLVVTLLVLLIGDRGRWKQRVFQFALFGIAALVSFAPLGLYFLRHPDAFTTRMSQVGPGDDWSAALDGIVTTLKMLFIQGDPYIRFNLPFRPLFDPVVAVLFLIGLGVTVWRFFRARTPEESCALARETLLLVWIPTMLLPTALAVGEIMPSNLRAVGLIPLVFVFPARGLYALLTVTRYQSRGFVTCLLLLATAFTTTRAYFCEYVSRTDLYEASDGDLADIATYLNQADLTDTTVYVGSIHYRHPTVAFLAEAYSQVKWLVGASTAVYPTSGEALYLFPRSANPSADWLTRYLPDAVSIEATTATDGAPAFAGYRLSAPPSLPDQVLADFSGVVRLLRYRVERAISGGEVDVTVLWQVLASPPHSDLTLFYHLVDPWGGLWGQAEPFQYAAEGWTPGEVVINRVRVPVAPGAPPGEYLLRVGLYSQSASTRLAVVDAAGRFIGSTVPLSLTVARAEALPEVDSLGIRQRLDLGTSIDLRLLGANLDTTQARPGERVHLTLFWQAGGIQDDYTVKLFLQDVAGEPLELYQGAPVHGTYPINLWADGEIIIDRYNPRLPLAAVDVPPGDYPLALSLIAPDGKTLLGPTVLGTFSLVAADRTFDVPTISHTQHVTLDNWIEFLGYDINSEDARPGGTIQLTLYWRALTEMDTSYTVFTHLLGPDDHTIAQQDNLPINGTYPTTLWLPGEIIADFYKISLPTDLSPGDYPIEVGFYVAENGLRLADPIVLNTVVTSYP